MIVERYMCSDASTEHLCASERADIIGASHVEEEL